jgi:hypothetical protein
MQAILFSVPTLSVSLIYCIWHAYARHQLRQHRQRLQERVAWMLWVMAQRVAA